MGENSSGVRIDCAECLRLKADCADLGRTGAVLAEENARLREALEKARRLLDSCVFGDPNDQADLDAISAALKRQEGGQRRLPITGLRSSTKASERPTTCGR